MTSPDIESSIEDPSPTLPELVHDALGLQIEGRFGYGPPNPAVDTFQTMSGAIILKRLLPDFSNEAIYLVRDAITMQHEVLETTSGTLTVQPTSLFSGWLQKLRRKPKATPLDSSENPLDRIEIVDEITGHTRQMHVKTYPDNHALVVRETTVSGSFSLDNDFVQFDPEASVIEIAKLSYDPSDYHAHVLPKSRRYFTYMPADGVAYRSKQFGGSIDDHAIKNARLHAKTVDEMQAVLREIQAANNIIEW